MSSAAPASPPPSFHSHCYLLQPHSAGASPVVFPSAPAGRTQNFPRDHRRPTP
jgi:hypothetical protein